MSVFERIFHSILFEVIALIIMTFLAVFITGKNPFAMVGLAITLSLIAMVWNYIYNQIFDRIYGTNRLSRSLKLRIFHGSCFEFGMMVFSFPLLMMFLNKDLLTVFMLDIGTVVFFLIYAVIFNWIYDIIRSLILPYNSQVSED